MGKLSKLWDEDIATSELSDTEKNGLQLFRNYQKAFEDHAEKLFAQKIDETGFDSEPLDAVLKLIASEDPRFLPVIACAYVDDLLEKMFRAYLPDEVPGGTKSLFGPYGPMSSLFNRLQLAFAFDILSADLVKDLDRLRKGRNELSHTWNISTLQDFYVKGEIKDLFPIDELLTDQKEKIRGISVPSDSLQAFRIRLAWLLSRLTYEAAYFPIAKQRRLNPQKALFGKNHPKLLSAIVRAALETTRGILSIS